jgi:ubiquinol-cytochrome c reductase cytochrome b subunit
MPNALGHPDNYIPANPLVTPAHIVPEWYFLPFYAILRAVTFDVGIPFTDIVLIPAKLGGVLAMFGSIALLFALPFLDKHPVRSSRFRPWYRAALILFVINAFVLGVCGAKPAEGFWVPLSQITTIYYYAFFLVLIPIFNKKEPVLELPKSINEAVLKQNKKAA